jgi:hypothetical protein
MKKNIIIGLLTLVSVLSITYGYYQKNRADKNELRADENEQRAREMMMRAEEQQKLADQQRVLAQANMLEAHRQRMLAEEELKKRRPVK